MYGVFCLKTALFMCISLEERKAPTTPSVSREIYSMQAHTDTVMWSRPVSPTLAAASNRPAALLCSCHVKAACPGAWAENSKAE